ADVILLGTGCDAEGTKSVADLVAANPSARVIVLADEADADAHRQALDLGAMGIVRKEDAPELLIKAIRKVHAGEFWFDRAFLASVLQERRPGGGHKDPHEGEGC